MSTFRVATRTQAALFVCELKGQISDGHWENAYPLNHWKAPCDADVVVDSVKQGRDFYASKTYAFAQSWLCNPKHKDFIPMCHDRCIAYAKAAKHFIHLSIKDLSDFQILFEGDWA